jgi:hypothetical protein
MAKEIDLHEIFSEMAARDQKVMRACSHVAAMRALRKDVESYARNRKKNPDWKKFQSLLAGSYSLLEIQGDKAEAELSEDLGILSPLIMRDYILGDARPAPEKAATICAIMADILLVKEADVFAETARRCVFLRHNDKRAAKL